MVRRWERVRCVGSVSGTRYKIQGTSIRGYLSLVPFTFPLFFQIFLALPDIDIVYVPDLGQGKEYFF